MICVVLLSNTSNDIYLDNKISSFKVKLSDIAGGPRALGSSTERNSVSSFMLQCEERKKVFYWLEQYYYRASLQLKSWIGILERNKTWSLFEYT